ncbi:MAG: hypothetical protein IIB36_13855 [Gemmatimonadetes bacterium]|nr:hypothetical protein [Gemmatimonadota bacterium]
MVSEHSDDCLCTDQGLRRRHSCPTRSEDYATAVRLYGGPFLSSLRDTSGGELSRWIESENDRIWTGLEVALATLIRDARGAGDHRREVELAERYCDLNPLSERATRFLIQGLRSLGEETAHRDSPWPGLGVRRGEVRIEG